MGAADQHRDRVRPRRADRLWATVYEHDLPSIELWVQETGIPRERVQVLGIEDNYWHMGVPRPVRPLQRDLLRPRPRAYGREGGPAVDDTRYIEVWNLVFMEFERGAGKGYEFPVLGALPKQNIDTGMGLERVACILQGVENVYETDLLRPILDRAVDLTGVKYGSDPVSDVQLRIVAEHLRTSTMLIGDGVTPTNEGRGYVLRRMLRRAVRNIRLLGGHDPVVNELVQTTLAVMGPSFPELLESQARILNIATTEEAAFLQTLKQGTTIFDLAATSATGGVFGGDKAFQLHDTFGFPIDLTLEMAAEAGLTVDEETFRDLMLEQRTRAKADRAGKAIGNADVSVWQAFLAQGNSVFDGYDELSFPANVVGVVVDGESVPVAGVGSEVQVVLDRTPFYPEGGGQVGDKGVLRGPEGLLVQVLDTQKVMGGLIVHTGIVSTGMLLAGTSVTAEVDEVLRRGAQQAHTGTHVIHRALHQVLGPDASQAGSYVMPGRLRFDFSWSSALTPEQLHEIQEISVQAIDADLPAVKEYMPIAEAKAKGAIAMFSEKYGETVRVLTIGDGWSTELCGGTHVDHTAQIGPLVVLGEASIGSGIRRIEALVGLEAYHHLDARRQTVVGLSDALKAPAEDVSTRVLTLADRVRALEKELAGLKQGAVLAAAPGLFAGATDVSGVALVVHEAPSGTGADALRTLALDVRGRFGTAPAVVAIAVRSEDGKASLVVATNEASRARGLAAGELVKAATPKIGGGGGGKPDVAQGGGTNGAGVAAALAEVSAVVTAKLA